MAISRQDEGGCIVDYRLELVLLPVSDVDRAKSFYTEKAGFTSTSTPSPLRISASSR
jgi:hypothetical protein